MQQRMPPHRPANSRQVMNNSSSYSKLAEKQYQLRVVANQSTLHKLRTCTARGLHTTQSNHAMALQAVTATCCSVQARMLLRSQGPSTLGHARAGAQQHPRMCCHTTTAQTHKGIHVSTGALGKCCTAQLARQPDQPTCPSFPQRVSLTARSHQHHLQLTAQFCRLGSTHKRHCKVLSPIDTGPHHN